MEKHKVDVWQYPHMLVERYTCAPGPIEGVARHVHNTYQFCLSIGVACVYEYRGARHIVPHGQMNVLHPGEPHATSDAEPRPPGTIYHMLYLNPNRLREITSQIREQTAESPYFSTPIITDKKLLQLFRALYSALEEGTDQLEQDCLFFTTISQLVLRHAQNPLARPYVNSTRPAILLVRDFLHANPRRNISLEELANIAELSEFHLCHAFQQELGLPPHEYHLNIRISHAKALLACGLPLAQVAQQTGFYDQSRFSRYFRRFVGTTPAYYARNSKNCLEMHNRKR